MYLGQGFGYEWKNFFQGREWKNFFQEDWLATGVEELLSGRSELTLHEVLRAPFKTHYPKNP